MKKVAKVSVIAMVAAGFLGLVGCEKKAETPAAPTTPPAKAPEVKK